MDDAFERKRLRREYQVYEAQQRGELPIQLGDPMKAGTHAATQPAAAGE